MAGNLRKPATGGSRNGKKQLEAAANSGKKTTSAKTPNGSSLALSRLQPVKASYSKKRDRPQDNDDFHEAEDFPSRQQQGLKRSVITPSSIANHTRQTMAAKITPKNTALPHEMQARLPQKQTGNGAITPYRSNNRHSWNSNSNWGGNHSRPTYLASTAAPADAPAGLINLGNTCYLNAVLQSLFSLPTFPGAINAAVAMGGEALASDGVLRALGNCLAQRNVSSAAGRSAFSPEQVKAAVGRRLGAFRGSFQQDAHEFFCGLLETVQSEVLAIESQQLGRRQVRASETTDPTTRVFGFAVEHEITCTECNHVSHVTEQCTHLSLDLPKGSGDNKTPIVPPGLDSMLSSYFQEESVEKGCEACGAECVQHTVRHRISRLPQILALHLKRFQVTFQQSTGTVTCLKVRNPVSIPTGLRVKPFCVEKPAMPLPPLKAEDQKENLVLNNNTDNEDKSLILAPPKLNSPSPPPAPESGIRSSNFYSGVGNLGANAFDRLMDSQPLKTFARRKQQKLNVPVAKGAAVTSYWDKTNSGRNVGAHGVHWADKASTIVQGAGTDQKHRRNYEEEEDADFLAAIEASKKDQHYAAIDKSTPATVNNLFSSFKGENGGSIDDELDADLATALKRSLEEQQYVTIDEEEEEEKEQQRQDEDEDKKRAEKGDDDGKIEIIDLGESVTPVKNRAALVNTKAANNNNNTLDISKSGDENLDKDVDAPPPRLSPPLVSPPPPKTSPASAPIPEIVEDDAKIETEGGSKEQPLLEIPTTASTVTPATTSKQALAHYQLTAVISHHGSSAESGHFTADTRNSTTGQWYRFNDAQVNRIRGDAATNEMREQDCYMLFYTISSS